MSIENNEIFPFVQFNGTTARERGHEHGTILSERIDRSIKIYRQQFSHQKNYHEKSLLHLCEQYRRGISSDYLDELDAIAIASKQDPLWIIALNCRLELLNHLAFERENECTVLYDSKTCRLAENWDWLEDFQSLAFVNYIQSNKVLQMTEPGVLGKVGLNSHGIGVTINFIDPSAQPKTPSNIPLHVSLRTVLDQAETLEQALQIFEQNGPGFGGHCLVGDNQGRCCCVEFPGDKVRFLRNQPYHTNHFLSLDNNDHIRDKPRYQNSLDRYERVRELWDNQSSLQTILFDHDEQKQNNPICRSYKATSLGQVGTVCSIIMDLKEGIMDITKGNPRQNPTFYQYQIEQNQE